MNHLADNDDTYLIQMLKHGDKEAANELIGRYFERVSAAAEKYLNGRRVHVTSPDDIAASVFESLWERADQLDFSDGDLKDSTELWRLLSTMVVFKANSHLRRERAQKRGGDVLKGESDLGMLSTGQPRAIAEVEDKSAARDQELANFQDEHERLMRLLDSDILMQVAAMRMEGHRVLDIAAAFEKSERWVSRKIALIRGIWEDQVRKEEE